MQAGDEGHVRGVGGGLGEAGVDIERGGMNTDRERERERTDIRTGGIMPLCVIPSLRVQTSIAGPLATWELSLEG